MVDRGEPLKETRGQRRFHDDLGAESDRNEAWRPMSEVVSLAVLWLDSRSYQSELGEFSLVKDAVGANFCQQGWVARKYMKLQPESYVRPVWINYPEYLSIVSKGL